MSQTVLQRFCSRHRGKNGKQTKTDRKTNLVPGPLRDLSTPVRPGLEIRLQHVGRAGLDLPKVRARKLSAVDLEGAMNAKRGSRSFC
jgi:hypothetical protein